MLRNKNNSGFTLIEIIISIFILGIIGVVIIPLIGDSVLNIVTIGQQDQAVNTATSFTEIAHQKVILYKELTTADWQDLVNSNIYYEDELVDIEYKICADIDTNPEETKIHYCQEKTSGGYKLKVIFFYQEGKKSIKLDSFITFKRG